MRVGAPALAVGEGELLCLDHDVDRIGRQQSHRGEVEILEDLELLEQHEAGRIGRRLEHGKAAIIDADRLLHLGLEGCEIAGRDQSPRASRAAASRLASAPR